MENQLMKKIIVNDLIKTNIAVSTDDAKQLFDALNDCMQSHTEVEVDFSNLKTIATAFFNVSIGDLYLAWDRRELNKYIHISANSLTPLQKNKLKMVMDNTRTKLSSNKNNFDGEVY